MAYNQVRRHSGQSVQRQKRLYDKRAVRRPVCGGGLDIGIPWGHQVAVMFQIVCALTLEVPLVLRDIESLHSVSPNVILSCEPWGHMDHSGGNCECLSSDSMGAYVHDLSLVTEEASPVEVREDLSSFPFGDYSRESQLAGVGAGHPGSVPFVSHRPGAYGRLLLAVYVRWKTGLLVASDWLHPVTRGAGGQPNQSQRALRLTSAD